MSTHTITVEGMTCRHCVASVTEELTALPGVTDVSVDLESGAVSITSTDPIDPAAVEDAVDEAGYRVVTS